MTGFEFDRVPSPGTNRAATRPCPTCDGHRLVPADDDEQAYRRCPQCNPAPTSERKPVEVDAWWKQ